MNDSSRKKWQKCSQGPRFSESTKQPRPGLFLRVFAVQSHYWRTNFELLTNICCAIYWIDLIYLANKNRHIKIARVDEAFFQSVVSVLKLHLYKSLFLSVSRGTGLVNRTSK